MTFHVGQKVVCVDNRRHKYTQPLVLRQVYTIRALQSYVRTNGLLLTGVMLEEASNRLHPNGHEYDYRLNRFRPVKTTDISIFEKMLTKAPSKVPA